MLHALLKGFKVEIIISHYLHLYRINVFESVGGGLQLFFSSANHTVRSNHADPAAALIKSPSLMILVQLDSDT